MDANILNRLLPPSRISALGVTTVAAIVVAAYVLLVGVLELDRPKAYRAIPRLSSWGMLGDVLIRRLPFRERYARRMRGVLERHGISRVTALGRTTVHLATPGHARRLLLEGVDEFRKVSPVEQFPQSFMARLLGRNMAYVVGPEWRRHRRVCNPAFHRSWPTETFADCTRVALRGIAATAAAGGPVDVTVLMKRLTLDALGRAMFGFDFHAVEEPDNKYVRMYHDIMRQGFSPLYTLLPWLDGVPLFRRGELYRAMDDFDALLLEIIEARRAGLRRAEAGGPPDLLTLMIEANEGEEGGLTDEELRANVAMFFVAGHDTTAGALACALYHIARDPALQERLHAEVAGILGPPASAADAALGPTADDIRRMALVDAVIKETLRIDPPVVVLRGRSVKETTPIGPYAIPPDVEVQLNIYSIHHNPKYWEEPDRFRPERFLHPDHDALIDAGTLADEGKPKMDPYMWLPFSYGSRGCIGMNFSLIEQRVVLSMLVHRFEMSLPADSPHANGLQFVPFGIPAPRSLEILFTPRY